MLWSTPATVAFALVIFALTAYVLDPNDVNIYYTHTSNAYALDAPIYIFIFDVPFALYIVAFSKIINKWIYLYYCIIIFRMHQPVPWCSEDGGSIHFGLAVWYVV